MIPDASRRLDWHTIVRTLSDMDTDTLRTKLRWWGVGETIAAHAVPHSFIWVPADFGTVIPAGVMVSGKRWLVLIPEGFHGGPYMFKVRTRGSEPPNPIIRMWADEPPAGSHNPQRSQSA